MESTPTRQSVGPAPTKYGMRECLFRQRIHEFAKPPHKMVQASHYIFLDSWGSTSYGVLGRSRARLTHTPWYTISNLHPKHAK